MCGIRSNCVFPFLGSPLRHPCLHHNVKWSAIYEEVVYNDVHHAWSEASDSNCIPHLKEWAGQMLQSCDSHSTMALCCPEPEVLGHIRDSVTVAYNSQVHKSTNPTSYILLLSRHLLGPTTASQPNALAFDSFVDIYLRWLSLNLRPNIAELQAKVYFQLKRRGAQFKWNYGAILNVKPEFIPSQWIFVDKHPLTCRSNAAKEMARVSNTKLQTQKTGQFQTTIVQPHTVVIDEEKVPSTVSVHKVTAAKRLKRALSQNGADAGHT